MEIVLTITVPLPKPYANKVERLQRKYFGVRLVDEPHITLYLCKFPQKNYDKLLEAFAAHKLKRFPVTISDIKIEKLFYFYEARGTALNQLHKKVLRTANPYRENLIRHKDLIRIKNGQLDKSKIRRLLAYGYTQVLSGFNPHITLGTKAVTIPKALLRIPQTKYIATSFVVSLCKYYEDTDAYVTMKKQVFRLT